MEEFDYRIHWRSDGLRPGRHRSLREGSGVEFSGHVELLNASDPRRLDLRASIANPYRQWLFRRYRQSGEIRVAVLADLSASMAYAGRQSKQRTLARLVRLIGRSAQHVNDSFSFVGADEDFRADLYLPPTRSLGSILELAERIEALKLPGRSCRGLLQAAERIAGRRQLLFLVSDFHFPQAEIERLLDSLAAHHLVPLVLWDASETDDLPAGGFSLFEDAETGRTQPIWMRPAMAARWREEMAERRRRIEALFLAHQATGLFLGEDFAPEVIGEAFRGGM